MPNVFQRKNFDPSNPPHFQFKNVLIALNIVVAFTAVTRQFKQTSEHVLVETRKETTSDAVLTLTRTQKMYISVNNHSNRAKKFSNTA